MKGKWRIVSHAYGLKPGEYCAVLCIASECADVCDAIECAVQMVCLSCVALAGTLTSALHAVACRANGVLKKHESIQSVLELAS